MITVKGMTLSTDEVLSYLKQELLLKQICYRILHQRIVHTIAQDRNIEITDVEIQAEVNRIRYQSGLFHPTDVFAWLSDQLVTLEEWETGIRDRLLTQKVSERLFAKAAERFFSQHLPDFDQVLLYRIVVPYAQLAQEIAYEIEEGEISFYEAAHLYDVDQTRRYHCGYEGKCYRWMFQPDLSAIVFSAVPGQLIGPLTIDQESHLLLIEDIFPAELTAARQQEIVDRLFTDWLTHELNYLFTP